MYRLARSGGKEGGWRAGAAFAAMAAQISTGTRDAALLACLGSAIWPGSRLERSQPP
jgi:hypothetical protein